MLLPRLLVAPLLQRLYKKVPEKFSRPLHGQFVFIATIVLHAERLEVERLIIRLDPD